MDNPFTPEDIILIGAELQERHMNLFHNITEEEFQEHLEDLAARVESLDRYQTYVELDRLFAMIGDAHTTLIHDSERMTYPLQFYLFEEGVAVTNADKSLEQALWGRVTAIHETSIEDVVAMLTQLIPHENESWLKYSLPAYLSNPVYLYGLGVIPDLESTVFTLELEGAEISLSIPVFKRMPDYCLDASAYPTFFQKSYSYDYLVEEDLLLFEYNQCMNDPRLPFADFNQGMFEEIDTRKPDKIVIDLRKNTGGNSSVLNPFTDKLQRYLQSEPQTQVYLLIGRSTFSSGIFAIMDIKNAVPECIAIGECTGGAVDGYGEVRSYTIRRLGVAIIYSINYFALSQYFSEPLARTDTYVPDVAIELTFADYQNGVDPVLEYIIAS